MDVGGLGRVCGRNFPGSSSAAVVTKGAAARHFGEFAGKGLVRYVGLVSDGGAGGVRTGECEGV